MPSFITESYLYKIFDVILINPYKNSLLKKNVNSFVLYFKDSFLYKVFERYINKSPYFLNSFSYNIFRKLIGLIDKIMDRIHNFFKKIISGSYLYEEFYNTKKMNIGKKVLLVSILIFSLSIGYFIGGIIFKTSNNLIVSNSLFTIGFIFYIVGVNPDLCKGSFVCKGIKYLFKLVKL